MASLPDVESVVALVYLMERELFDKAFCNLRDPFSLCTDATIFSDTGKKKTPHLCLLFITPCLCMHVRCLTLC